MQINKNYKKKNPAKSRLIKKREYQKNKRKYINRMYMQKYGIGLEDFESKLRDQKFLCKICLQKDTSKKGFHLDHCHKTNVVRDILCNHCNRLIGACKESTRILKNAVEYIERWSAAPTSMSSMNLSINL